ncbi:MAG: helicase C-terminal domain-containing protein, partial [Armatimonadota bacterium]|nr:helicase C-terminal domain-containing protein [Armatimonadota bacterium]
HAEERLAGSERQRRTTTLSPAGATMTLKNCLEGCSVVELRSMARRQGFRLHSLLKRDIISQLENHILEQVKAGSHHADLGEASQSALASVLDRGGIVPLAEIEGRFGPLRRAIPGAIDSGQPWGDGLMTPLDHLHCWGLLFHSISGGEAVALIPVDILEKLRPASVPRPKVFRACAAPAAPAAPSHFLCHNIMLLASALQDAPVHCRTGGSIGRRDLFRLNSYLLLPDDIGLARTDEAAPSFCFLRTIAVGLGLIALSDSQLGPGPCLPEWLQLSTQHRRLRTILAYLNLAPGIELDSIPTLTFPQPPQGAVLTSARRFLLGLLEEAEGGEWYTTASFVQAARARNSFLIRSPGDGTDVRCAVTGRVLTARDWTTVEGAWIESSLRGPLYWLGLVEPGSNRKGELTSFRVRPEAVSYLRFVARAVSALGESAFPDEFMSDIQTVPGAEAQTGETSSVSVAVSENLEVSIDTSTDLQRWFRLERICDLISRGSVSRYRIGREKVRQRLQSGESAESILAPLGSSIPPSVSETIKNWSLRFGQVRLFSATVLSAVEPALLAELKGAPDIAACLDQPLGSRACTIVRGKEDDIVNLLRARGEMPHVEGFLPPHLSPDGWQEIQQALSLWKECADGSGEQGPSDAVCQAVLDIIALPGWPDSPVPTEQDGETSSDGALRLLEEAVKRRRSIVFDYTEPGHEGCRLVAQPKGLVQQGGINFITAFPKGGSHLVHYRVDCIKDLALAGRP